MNNLQVKEVHRIFDSTKLQCAQKCLRKYFYEHVLGYKSELPSHNLEFGIAVHYALEILSRKGYSVESVEEAYSAFLHSYRESFPPETDLDYPKKNPQNVELGLYEYVKQYRNDCFEVLHTEVHGVVQLSDEYTLHCNLDVICKEDNKYFVIDHKTAGADFGWWPKFHRQQIQTQAYTHFICSLYGPENVYGLVHNRLIFLKNNFNFGRFDSPVNFSRLGGWLHEMEVLCSSIEAELRNVVDEQENQNSMFSFPRNTSSCIQYNRICSLYDICFAWENPLRHLHQIPEGYKVDLWDPREKRSRIDLGVK